MNQDDFIHALCLWREARGEGLEGMQAVSNVIRNRAQKRRQTIYEVVTAPWQFSAVTAPGDPLLHIYPGAEDREWKLAQEIVGIRHLPDITNGADHYLNPQVVKVMPSWTRKLRKVATIGRHDFYV